MRVVLFLPAVIFSVAAWACPDVSGAYIGSDGLALQYRQSGCSAITRFLGEPRANGRMDFPEPGTTFAMDGQPSCSSRKICTTVIARPNGIEFKLNFTGGVATDTHGQCSHTGYILWVDQAGNLLADFNVTHCSDKFTGVARKTFRRLL